MEIDFSRPRNLTGPCPRTGRDLIILTGKSGQLIPLIKDFLDLPSVFDMKGIR